MYIAQEFDHTTLTDLGVLILVSFLSISTLAIIQQAAALRDSSTTTNTSTQSFIPYNRINGKGIVILEGATLIDGTATPPKSDSVIVINRNKIVDVSDTIRFYYNQNNNSSYHLNTTKNLVLNLTGKYIIPGLFDMHAHVAGVLKNSFNETKSENMLRMLLVNGVTTIRNPGGPTAESVMLKEEVDSGKIKGPKIFTAGRLINSPDTPVPFVEKQATTEQEVKEEVRRQASAGVDYVKLYVGLRPNLVKAVIDEAHVLGIKVIGHLYLTSWTTAANLGIDALTHGVPVSPYLLPKNKQQTFLEKGGGPFDHLLWLDMVDLNDFEIKQMITTLVKKKVPVDPTLDIYEAMLKDDAKDQYLWSKVLRLTKMMYDNGVEILAGTDIPNFELTPGTSLHHELKLLVESGIDPLDVIRIATRNGADALGIINKVGTIEYGKEANMIILTSNPVTNIGNIDKIEAVINDGRFIDKDITHSMEN